MKLWKWENGRQQGCDYQKLPLWYFKIYKFGFDAYVLKYNGNQVLPVHKDPLVNGKHWRLNIGYGKSNFLCVHTILSLKIGKFSVYLFRPDLYDHSLIVHNKTIKISIGFAKYK